MRLQQQLATRGKRERKEERHRRIAYDIVWMQRHVPVSRSRVDEAKVDVKEAAGESEMQEREKRGAKGERKCDASGEAGV